MKPLQQSASDEWDDTEIVRRFQECPGFPESADEGRRRCVVKICDDTVVKCVYNTDEEHPHPQILAMELVSRYTNILIPRLRRAPIQPLNDTFTYLVMEHIDGESLANRWDSLPQGTRNEVIDTLRDYISQLRQIPSSHPGPIGPSPRRCYGPMFGGDRGQGPFADYEVLSGYYDMVLSCAAKRIPQLKDSRKFDGSVPLVFTHNNLSMDHMILGKDNRIWIVGWNLAGCYPRWFESVSMLWSAEEKWIPGWEEWKDIVTKVAGDPTEHSQWMHRIRATLFVSKYEGRRKHNPPS